MAALTFPSQTTLNAIRRKPDTTVTLPGSKSITNRALLIAALADGVSTLRAPLHSDDTEYMARALQLLGIGITELGNGDFVVSGSAGRFQRPSEPTLFIGNSGTTVRFLTAATCLMPPDTNVVLDGVARMRERPIRDLLDALQMLGVNVESVQGGDCPPVRVHGGGMPGGECRLRGNITSQFLSALLMVAPFADSDVCITIDGDLVSKPYVDITQSVMRAFGADFENDACRQLKIPAGQQYAARDYPIEADASNASYFLAAAAVSGGTVKIGNLGSDSIQGDVRFIDVLERMGCQVTRGAHQLSVTGPERLRGIEVDMEAIPDTAQTLAVVAAFADSPSRITGIGNLRVKETDRIHAIAVELAKLGVAIEEGSNYWVINPCASDSFPSAAAITFIWCISSALVKANTFRMSSSTTNTFLPVKLISSTCIG